jgi:hypothetical protein
MEGEKIPFFLLFLFQQSTPNTSVTKCVGAVPCTLLSAANTSFLTQFGSDCVDLGVVSDPTGPGFSPQDCSASHKSKPLELLTGWL